MPIIPIAPRKPQPPPEEREGYKYIEPEPSPLEKIFRLPGDIYTGAAKGLRDIGDWWTTGTPGRYELDRPAMEGGQRNQSITLSPDGMSPSSGQTVPTASPASANPAPFMDTDPDRIRGGVSWQPGQHNLGTEEALAGLRANQETDASPFSEQELFRLASRDPGSVQPGSNQYWGSVLKGQQDRSATMQGVETDAIKGIRGAMGTLHPAVQQAAEAQATRGAYPAMSSARGIRDAAEANAEASMYGSDVDRLNAVRKGNTDLLGNIATQIGNIRDKPAQTAEDDQMLRSLIGLFNSLSKGTTGAVFQDDPTAR